MGLESYTWTLFAVQKRKIIYCIAVGQTRIISFVKFEVGITITADLRTINIILKSVRQCV